MVRVNKDPQFLNRCATCGGTFTGGDECPCCGPEGRVARIKQPAEAEFAEMEELLAIKDKSALL